MGTTSKFDQLLREVVLPGLTVFEKSGSLINRSFFLQSFDQAIPGPAGSND